MEERKKSEGARFAASFVGRVRIVVLLLIATLGIKAYGQTQGYKIIDKRMYMRDGQELCQLVIHRRFGLLSILPQPRQGAAPFTKALVGMRRADSSGSGWMIALEDGRIQSLEASEVEIAAAFDAAVRSGEGSFTYNSQIKAGDPKFDLRLDDFALRAWNRIQGVLPDNKKFLARLGTSEGGGFPMAALGDAVRHAGNGKLELALIFQNSKERMSLCLRWKPEYFRGEAEFFNTHMGGVGDYDRKAAALLGKYWLDFPKPYGVIIQNLDAALALKPAFLYAMASDLLPLFSHEPLLLNNASQESASFPYPIGKNLDSKLVNLLEPQARVNPYLASYLDTQLRFQKPLYSQGVRQAEEGIEAGFFPEGQAQAYLYPQYRELSASEGRSLASVALRYYLWGLEYSVEDLQINKDQSIVYGNNLALVSAWIEGSASSGEAALAQSRRLRNHMPQANPLGQIESEAQAAVKAEWPLLTLIDADMRISPFKNPADGFVAGNPLPYVVGGIDSPRSFAYKLVQQRTAREALKKKPADALGLSTKAFGMNSGLAPASESIENYWKYGNPKDASLESLSSALGGLENKQASIPEHKTLKPFTPFVPDEKKSKPDMVAGVDALGFFLGSLAMTEFSSAFTGPAGSQSARALSDYDSFYASNKRRPGLDDEGYPIFALSEGFRGKESGGYRLPRLAFERTSVLIPSLSQARIGDIVMHYGDADEDFSKRILADSSTPDIGFIVRYAAVPEDCIVLHMSSQTKRVKLDRLSDILAQGKSKGQGYHLRRVLIKGATVPERAERPEWELLDNEVVTMSLGLDFSQAKPLHERWIPNTGQYRGFKLRAGFFNRAGRSLNWQDVSTAMPSLSLALNGCVDRGYDPTKASQDSYGNIFNNQGDGFELVLKGSGDFEESAALPLLRFRRPLGGETSDVYQIESLNLSIIGDDGKLKSPYRWEGKYEKGMNTLSIVSTTNPELRYTSFGIRPLSASGARPGDDILLSMSLKKSETLHSDKLDATAGEDSYLAVYDAKMLWRANLYIEETPEINDWNRLHPWNAPASGNTGPKWWSDAWGHNEWNLAYSFPAGTHSIDAGSKDSGCQTILPHSSYWWKEGNEFNKSVAYSMECHDSPFEFNQKMDQQKALLHNAFYTRLNPYNKSVMVRGKPEPTRSSWSSTLAPLVTDLSSGSDNPWYNYRKESSGFALSAGPGLPPGFPAMTYYPYRPGLSSAEANTLENRLRSAGVDCVGLVQRALSYQGESYALSSIGGYTWTSTAQGSGTRTAPTVAADGGLWKIMEIMAKEDRKKDPITNEWIYPKLSQVVPGDIIYYPGHTMMVADITRSGSGDVRPEDVRIIEAVHWKGWAVFGVTKRNKLKNYTDGDVKSAWVIGRLK